MFIAHKFREYILGKATLVQTDHQPLETILRKPMSVAPLRLQAMILKVSGFDLKVEYLPGIKQILADTLNRASVDELPAEEDELQVNMVKEFQSPKQSMPNSCKTQLYTLIQVGWPETKQKVPHSTRQYWDTRDELAVLDGVIYRGMRIVIPPSMKPEHTSEL